MVETRSGRRFAVFFFLAAFLVLLAGRWLKPVDNAVLAVAAPFQAIVSVVSTGIGDIVSGAFDGPRLSSENAALRRQNGALIRRLLLLQEQQHENLLLRRMLQYEDTNNRQDYAIARVIGNDPNSPSESILIDRGTSDRVRKGMTVLDQNGYFVGTIADTTPHASRVLLMISPSSSVGAMDMSTRAGGMVEGQYAAKPRLKYVVASAKLRKNDFVVTSGLDNLFPRTVLLGQIVSVRHRPDTLFQTAEIQPAASFGNLEMVQVVRGFVPSAPTKFLTPH